MRVVQEHQGEYPSLWAAVESIAPKIGCVPQTLLEWVKRVKVDTGLRDGVTIGQAQRVKDFERENKELRRSNEIHDAGCSKAIDKFRPSTAVCAL